MDFLTLYTGVQTRLVDSSDTRWSLDEKKSAVNWAYRELVMYAGWPRKTVTLDANGASTSEYVAPSGTEIAQIHDVSSHTLGRRLYPTTSEKAFDQYSNWETVTGQPYYYVTDYKTTTAGAVVVKTFPDYGSALTDLKAVVSVVPTALSADADVPAMPSNFHDALVDGAAAKLLIDATQARDLEAAGVWMQAFLAKRAEFAAYVMRGFHSGSRVVPYRNV